MELIGVGVAIVIANSDFRLSPRDSISYRAVH